MSCLCLFVHSGVRHILCCVFILFVFVLCTICCQLVWIVHFVLPSSVFSNFYWEVNGLGAINKVTNLKLI
jgi:hypothetical protein